MIGIQEGGHQQEWALGDIRIQELSARGRAEEGINGSGDQHSSPDSRHQSR